jgi:hypothetical protein
MLVFIVARKKPVCPPFFRQVSPLTVGIAADQTSGTTEEAKINISPGIFVRIIPVKNQKPEGNIYAGNQNVRACQAV